MEMELEPRVKPLSYKVKATSRESPSSKALHVLDTDLRNHWSTGTNTKEWILLELDEPCLLSHMRIYNKSVLEWEIAVGLRYKPETFTKVRPRCEAPRRDMMYPLNYTPCRYVRISCLRGNPIAIFFIQLIGVPVAGLEPAFQPVVNHLLPQIIARKQDADDIHLKLLQNITSKLLIFLPQLEVDLISFSDAPESNLRFLAMLAGPFYPLLHVVNERESTKSSSNVPESEVSKSNQTSSALTVSSNFAPRRSRNTSSLLLTSGIIAFRPDAVFVLLRKAYEDSNLGLICRAACRILQKIIDPCIRQEASTPFSNETSDVDEAVKPVSETPFPSTDYSNLFGEEFRMPEEHWDSSYLNILDISAVEEGILHVLYACASQPLLSGKLAENSTEMWSALPLIQALLPALRPLANSHDNIDESFSPWKQPYIQQALSQIVMTTSSSLYHPLLHAAAGYLSSYSQSHVKAACLLIDLCSNILAPWMPQVIAKVDLAVELLEELQATIQSAHHSLTRARAAIKYILLALSGHMDDILGKYKEVKQKILFLLEMLEPFLDPAITTFKSTIAFGDVCSNFLEKQEYNCEITLNVIRVAVRKPAVLPYLESEWRSGSVAPSVLLSILEPHLHLPPEIDRCKPPVSNNSSMESSQRTPAAFRTNGQDDHDGRTDTSDSVVKGELCEDVSIFFSPSELRSSPLTNVSSISDENASNASSADVNSEHKRTSKSQLEKNGVVDADFTAEYFNLQADYFQLANFRDCELKASEFQRLASDLHLQPQITPEGHDASIDALLLAAECYINPYFMKSSRSNLKDIEDVTRVKIPGYTGASELRSSSNIGNIDTIAHVEMKRDKIVLQLLIKAAELDRNYRERKISDDEPHGEHAVVFDRHILNLSSLDIQSDAITLVRQNQALLCNFLIRRLQKEQHSMHEILMQSLLFLLTSATRLSCNPGDVVDIILNSAEYLHELLTLISCNMKDNNMQSCSGRKHEVQRRWMLIQKMVIASSGDDEGSDFKISVYDGLRYVNLVPPSAWIERIPVFSVSASPLVRFVGWMAVSRNAKQYLRDRLFLASELSELTSLLFIFSDDLSLREKMLSQKEVDLNIDNSGVKQDSLAGKDLELSDQQYGYQSFDVIYPDIARSFPNMKKQFESFGDTILQAVGLQLRSIPSSMLSEILCWFSDLCSWPFPPKSLSSSPISFSNAKGFMAKNAKAVILYVLEAIVIEHMEAMIPEIPRLVHVLASLCRASHCDVSFLGSVLQLLKPIISYSLKKVAEEDLLTDDLCLNFESLCFNELFNSIRVKVDNQLDSQAELYRKPLIIFILASVFSDLSFQRKQELLHSLLFLADFTASEQTSLYHDYLCAYQCAMDSFKALMLQILRMFSIIPLQSSAYSGSDTPSFSGSTSKSHTWFLCDILSTEPDDASKGPEYSHHLVSIPNEKVHHLSTEQTKALIEDLENLTNKLNPTMEKCWMLHPQLTKKLVIASAECFVYIRCISSVLHNVHSTGNGEDAESPKSDKSSDQLSVHWQMGLQSLGENMLALLGNHCWIVSSIMLDCLLAVPHCFIKHISSSTICSAIAGFSCSAPKISWRLRADKWLLQLFARGIYGFHESEIPLVELFCTLLGHDEPEQRLIALKHLGKVIGQDVDGEQVLEYSESCNKLVSPNFASKISESILSSLVNGTWDNMTVMASSDSSLLLRTRAMAILVDFIPLANQHHLQSFLASADTLLNGLGNFAPPIFEGPYLQLSVALIAGCCLYLPKEDISLIPEDLWSIIESLGFSKPESEVRDVGKKICNAICRLRDEGNEQKEVLRFALSSSNWNCSDPHFSGTREAILQVLANLTYAESYFDAFSGELDEALEQEKAEIELEIIQNEHAPGEQLRSLKASGQMGSSGHVAAPVKDTNRLEQIKSCIQSIEKSRLREEVTARRQKVLLMRHTRKQFLEDAAARETELLHELDRERTAEVEKEIERQRQLEIERAKTRELRHSLEMERERQTQRELQRELEHYESGIRSSRRDFPSAAPPSRSRERYRERENGRSVHEGTSRSSSGSLLPEASTSSSMTMMPTVVLSASRSYASQPPTILQSRDRSDDCGSNYEENFDGSKDSGDTSSVGDPDLVSVFDGQSSLYGSSQRHGSRGSKSRQAAERRERDGRREGKWERKH